MWSQALQSQLMLITGDVLLQMMLCQAMQLCCKTGLIWRKLMTTGMMMMMIRLQQKGRMSDPWSKGNTPATHPVAPGIHVHSIAVILTAFVSHDTSQHQRVSPC